MQKVTIISGHPDIKNSTANKSILMSLEQLENVKIIHLMEQYPDYQIDVDKEINRLIKAEVIVLQFPFHWYGAPAILKKWIDTITTPLVYGSKKGALRGKSFLISTITGGPQESYGAQGYNKYTMEQFLLPLLKLGDSLGMKVLDPIVMHSASGDSELVISKAQDYAQRIIERIKAEYETVLER